MSLQIFDSRECRNCGETTFVKPHNGGPNYCGICGTPLTANGGLKSTRGAPHPEVSTDD